MSEIPVEAKAAEKPAGLTEIFLTFFRMGLTAFGPAMMAEAKKNISSASFFTDRGRRLKPDS